MTLEEFYDAAGGDYKAVLGRMLDRARVKKFVFKFAESDYFNRLKDAMDRKDYENAFLEAHNLKGMCMNIGVGNLADAASNLTESLRGCPKGDVEGLFEICELRYDETMELIGKIEG